MGGTRTSDPCDSLQIPSKLQRWWRARLNCFFGSEPMGANRGANKGG